MAPFLTTITADPVYNISIIFCFGMFHGDLPVHIEDSSRIPSSWGISYLKIFITDNSTPMGAWEQCMYHLQRLSSTVLVLKSVQYTHPYTKGNHLIQMSLWVCRWKWKKREWWAPRIPSDSILGHPLFTTCMYTVLFIATVQIENVLSECHWTQMCPIKYQNLTNLHVHLRIILLQFLFCCLRSLGKNCYGKYWLIFSSEIGDEHFLEQQRVTALAHSGLKPMYTPVCDG